MSAEIHGAASTRVAVVTGGAGAIGSAIVSALQAGGHATTVFDRAGDPPVDLTDAVEVRAAAADLLELTGRCDVLVHAAAAFDRAALSELDQQTWRRVQAVNVESALWLAQTFTPHMAERGFGRVGVIVSATA